MPGRLNNLIEHLHLHHPKQNKAVILVDEYDKPILDVIEQPELADANQNTLREFYAATKDSNRHVRFTFVTGISMFAQVSLFSRPNHLTDISLKKQYSTICGYTEKDFGTVFAPELEGLNREQIRKWYNGYSWLGTEKVYNPYDIMLCFDDREFRSYWICTGTPRSLFKTVAEEGFHPLMLENQEWQRALGWRCPEV
ncbi:MAG: AAA family ATPase [Gammaproteobacteria bacterium]|nr:AAA family ATPase [Gammaproteobacteria bacterium]